MRRRSRVVGGLAAGTLVTTGGLFLGATPAHAATTAVFIASSGTLSVSGDNLANSVTVSRNAAGTLLVNGGAIPVAGGTPTIVNIKRIQVFGLGGNDTLALSEINGALPSAFLFGGTGNDTLTGGSGADQIFGQSGDDIVLGEGGFDQLFGGSEKDTLTGGDADDQVFGESGDDRMIWNPGDDTDLNEGGEGTDRVEVIGASGADEFTAAANGARVRFDRVNPAPFSIDIGTSENLTVTANAGDDRFSATGNLAALIKVTVDGGEGQDATLGTNGVDVFVGGNGNDFVDGQQGNDVALLGAGDDTFQWDPGDGNDILEGQADRDTMVFNGSNVAERIEVLANGGRVLFTRDVASVVMDLNDLENVVFNALGGADNTVMRDLSGTDLTDVATNLASTSGGPDLAADTVRVEATNGDDVVEHTGSLSSQQVSGLSARVKVASAEPIDRLNIAAQNGDDVVMATSLLAPARAFADGGDGDDALLGSDGDDVLSGGNGDDVLLGNLGTDTLNGGPGDDILLGGEIVTDGLVPTKAWLARNVRTVNGNTVFDLGEKELTVPGVRAASLR
jgi:Ca2+-binding RTX toxin-like protein